MQRKLNKSSTQSLQRTQREAKMRGAYNPDTPREPWTLWNCLPRIGSPLACSSVFAKWNRGPSERAQHPQGAGKRARKRERRHGWRRSEDNSCVHKCLRGANLPPDSATPRRRKNIRILTSSKSRGLSSSGLAPRARGSLIRQVGRAECTAHEALATGR